MRFTYVVSGGTWIGGITLLAVSAIVPPAFGSTLSFCGSL